METSFEYKDSIMRSVQVLPLARPLSPEAIGFRGLGLSPEAITAPNAECSLWL